MGLQYPDVINCGGSVDGTNGAKVSGAGFSSARSNKGDFALTLDVPCDASECWINATPRGATSGVLRVVHTSDSVKQVLCFAVDGTTAADLSFDFTVFRAPF